MVPLDNKKASESNYYGDGNSQRGSAAGLALEKGGAGGGPDCGALDYKVLRSFGRAFLKEQILSQCDRQPHPPSLSS